MLHIFLFKDPAFSTDVIDGDSDPTPDPYVDDSEHGTRCAGEVAAEANNTHCTVGIAYNCKFGGMLTVSAHNKLYFQSL